MTNQSLTIGLVAGAIIAAVVGLIGRRFKDPRLNAAIASGLAFALGLPILLDYWQEPQRLFTPRQAVEWMPLGLMTLTFFTALAILDRSRNWIWLSLGVIAVIMLAGCSMYGSVYFRWGSLQWRPVAAILAWGGLIGVAWLAQMIANAPLRKVDTLLRLLALIAVSLNLALSGSFSYGAIGFLVALVSISGWLTSRGESPLVAAAGLLLLGLGPTFSEMQWSVAILLGVMMLALSSLAVVTSNKRRWSCIGLAMVCVSIGSGLTIAKLRKDTSVQSKEATGYEAYR